RKNGLNRLIRGVYGRTIGPDPRNFNQRASLGRNDLLIRTFPNKKKILQTEIETLKAENASLAEKLKLLEIEASKTKG
ncbi:hypothetical protein, partial [Aeromonas salmonicida]|uniref:hypothetical protein n=1 Tax=Aeromonas salmonicida TaxID=645 RepID=UPI0038CF85D6